MSKNNSWAQKAREAQEARWYLEREAREAKWDLERKAREALEANESQSEREARWAREAQEAQEKREKRAESAILSGLRQDASDKVKRGLIIRPPSGHFEFKLLCLACEQAGNKAVADYLHSKEAAKQALLQKARDEGGYG